MLAVKDEKIITFGIGNEIADSTKITRYDLRVLKWFDSVNYWLDKNNQT